MIRFARWLGRRLGDFFFAVGMLTWRFLGWLWRWVALPAFGLVAVSVALARDPWLGAVVASTLFAVVLVYATLLQLALERMTAAWRRHLEDEKRARDE